MPDVNTRRKKPDKPAKSRLSAVAERQACLAGMAALSASELRSLRSCAASRESALRGMRYYADAQDLVHEAIVRTLDGARKWRPQKADLLLHLRGCVRSIASEYEKKAQRRSEEPVDTVSCEEEARLHRRTVLEQASLFLRGDVMALQVFNLLLQGHTAGAIQSTLDLDKNSYSSVRRRMIRSLRAKLMT